MTFLFTTLLCLELTVGLRNAVLAGAYSKPRLSAQPSPVLAPGGNVTLQCVSKQQYDRFVLIKEGPQKLSWIMDSQYNQSSGQFEALFSLGVLIPNQLWTFRCYSNYRNKPQVWSEPSEPLELLFSGIYHNKPSLSVLPSPVVTSGGNMTLKCVSQERYDKFILTKEGQKFLSSMNSQYIHHIMQYQAVFSIDHVTPNHTGTFRCYGYYKNTPHLWSVPSDPLEIHISASETQDQTVENLIRMGMAGLILIVLGILMCEAWNSQRWAHNASGAYSEEADAQL
ncbi:leukocyte immunoglobulin-like receptor subfamily A member 2 [Peromyscus leucopus]|uniref:leukocyte immunoglobulin-like receptor subfamily A member 2 n=1 Tax=Peromyscus leucopus TaxID=10041 RepID=UPI00188587B7|nr:leukocyte immunoglobulin-like receptor subfamily A member 2 [Peromyscus leucopus]